MLTRWEESHVPARLTERAAATHGLMRPTLRGTRPLSGGWPHARPRALSLQSCALQAALCPWSVAWPATAQRALVRQSQHLMPSLPRRPCPGACSLPTGQAPGGQQLLPGSLGSAGSREALGSEPVFREARLSQDQTPAPGWTEGWAPSAPGRPAAPGPQLSPSRSPHLPGCQGAGEMAWSPSLRGTAESWLADLWSR